MSESTAVNDETVRAIRAALSAELDARNRVDAETHRQHHTYIQELIDCRARRREIGMRVVQHVIGWGAVLGIGWLGKLIWDVVAGVHAGGGAAQ